MFQGYKEKWVREYKEKKKWKDKHEHLWAMWTKVDECPSVSAEGMNVPLTLLRMVLKEEKHCLIA